jgi:hypothetical protein
VDKKIFVNEIIVNTIYTGCAVIDCCHLCLVPIQTSCYVGFKAGFKGDRTLLTQHNAAVNQTQ